MIVVVMYRNMSILGQTVHELHLALLELPQLLNKTFVGVSGMSLSFNEFKCVIDSYVELLHDEHHY